MLWQRLCARIVAVAGCCHAISFVGREAHDIVWSGAKKKRRQTEAKTRHFVGAQTHNVGAKQTKSSQMDGPRPWSCVLDCCCCCFCQFVSIYSPFFFLCFFFCCCPVVQTKRCGLCFLSRVQIKVTAKPPMPDSSPTAPISRQHCRNVANIHHGQACNLATFDANCWHFAKKRNTSVSRKVAKFQVDKKFLTKSAKLWTFCLATFVWVTLSKKRRCRPILERNVKFRFQTSSNFT